jgi:hypothetical protein
VNVHDPKIMTYNQSRTYYYEHARFGVLVKMIKAGMVQLSDGIHCIIVTNINSPTEKDIKTATLSTYFGKKGIKSKELFSSDSEGGFYHKYITYDINKEAKSFNELFKIPITTDYCKDNYKANSCYINLLVDTFHTAFSKCKKYKFNATYEDFCDLLDIDMEKDNVGLSINKSLKLFEKFSIKLMVVGVFGIIEAYEPVRRNKKITPDCLYILVSNGHCYKLNQEVKTFQQTLWTKNEQVEKEMSNVDISNLSTEYRIRDTNNVNYSVTYIEKLNDICEHVKQLWMVLYKHKLRIKRSELLNSGLGLFAMDPMNSDDHTVLFKKGDTIIEYAGEIIDIEELENRYDNKTAPYTVQISKNVFEDGAAVRGVGTLANTNPRHNNAKLSIYRGKATLKATKNIYNGDEIYLSYGRSYKLYKEGVEHSTKKV